MILRRWIERPEHGYDVVTGNCHNNWRWEITTIESWTMREAIPIDTILERTEASRWTDFFIDFKILRSEKIGHAHDKSKCLPDNSCNSSTFYTHIKCKNKKQRLRFQKLDLRSLLLVIVKNRICFVFLLVYQIFEFDVRKGFVLSQYTAWIQSLICCVSCQEKKAGKIIRQFTNSYILG